MKLYAGRIPTISTEIVEGLVAAGDIEVETSEVPEVSIDIESVLKEYLRVEREITDRARDVIANKGLPYNHLNKIKAQIAGQRGFGLADESIDYITDQIIEILFHTVRVEEVFSEDQELRKKMRPVLRKHMALDSDLDLEVRGRIKNLEEGTSTWEVEYQKVMEDLKHTKNL